MTTKELHTKLRVLCEDVVMWTKGEITNTNADILIDDFILLVLNPLLKKADPLIEPLPTVDEAGPIALTILGEATNLTAPEEAFFIAGFQECIKWLIINKYQEID